MSTQDAAPQAPKSVAAIVALVLGVIALATSFVPIVNNMSFVVGLIGAVFAVVGLVATLKGRKSGKGLAIASVIVNVLALVFVLASQSAYSAALDNAVVSTSDGTVTSSSASSDADSAAASQSSDSQASSNDSQGGQSDSSKYTIANDQLNKDSYTCSISGTFTNTSGKELSYVGVSYNVFDANGTQIGNAYDNTTNLGDGAAWKFDAYCTADPDEVASYQLADVTAY